jgi:hypothetical protein
MERETEVGVMEEMEINVLGQRIPVPSWLSWRKSFTTANIFVDHGELKWLTNWFSAKDKSKFGSVSRQFFFQKNTLLLPQKTFFHVRCLLYKCSLLSNLVMSDD